MHELLFQCYNLVCSCTLIYTHPNTHAHAHALARVSKARESFYVRDTGGHLVVVACKRSCLGGSLWCSMQEKPLPGAGRKGGGIFHELSQLGIFIIFQALHRNLVGRDKLSFAVNPLAAGTLTLLIMYAERIKVEFCGNLNPLREQVPLDSANKMTYQTSGRYSMLCRIHADKLMDRVLDRTIEPIP